MIEVVGKATLASSRSCTMAIDTPTRGLEHVIAAASSLAEVDGTAGTLRYCGYDIHDLVDRVSFEEVVALLWDGDLPTVPALASLREALAAERSLSAASERLLRALPATTRPMDALRTAVSALAAEDPAAAQSDLASAHRIAVRLTARIPVLLAAFGRIRQGLPIIAPRPDLGHAANLWWMYNGREPRPEQVAALEAYMVLLAEHSLNASTFAARVVVGSRGDFYGAVTAAIAALQGALHGGANQLAYEMLEEMGGAEGAASYVEEALKVKRRIMGIGHRIYKVEDPRVRHLRAHSERLAEAGADPSIHRTAEALQAVTASHPYFVERKLAPNVEFFSAPLLGALGFPADMFPPLFACSRIAGWSAHIFEQLRDNRLIRPKAAYTGPPPRDFVRIEKRTGI
jgi:citrate synthase